MATDTSGIADGTEILTGIETPALCINPLVGILSLIFDTPTLCGIFDQFDSLLSKLLPLCKIYTLPLEIYYYDGFGLVSDLFTHFV